MARTYVVQELAGTLLERGNWPLNGTAAASVAIFPMRVETAYDGHRGLGVRLAQSRGAYSSVRPFAPISPPQALPLGREGLQRYSAPTHQLGVPGMRAS